MGAKLDDSLRGENDRARWIFLFDSLGEIAVGWPTDQVRVLIAEFMTEVHRFLRPGDVRFNAIVATREYLMFPAGTPMIGIAPLSRHAQRKLMSSAGLGSIDQGRALDQFRYAAGEIAGRPLAFELWCEMVRSTSQEARPTAAPDNLHDFLAGIVGVRLSKSSASTAMNTVSLRFLADDIAYCMATEPGLALSPSRADLISALERRQGGSRPEIEAGLRTLEDLGLAVPHRPLTFAFTHRSFQDFFASSWLLRNIGTADLDLVLTDLRWRDATIMAMQVGREDFCVRVLERSVVLIGDLLGSLVSDLSDFLRVPPDQPLPLGSERTGSPPTPDPLMTHILSLVSTIPPAGLALVPDALREAADRLIVTAFLRSERIDQQPVLMLVRLMSPDVARWASQPAED